MDINAYVDFDLRFTKSGDGYRAEILQSPAGTAQRAFRIPFSDIELENYLLKIGQRRSGMRRADSPETLAARDFGRKLYDSVFADDVQTALRKSIDEVRANGNGLRIRLHLAETPELADLPWEYLWHTQRREFLALSTETPIVRYFDLETVKPLSVTPPLRVLVMLSNPSDVECLDVEKEWQTLKEAVGHLEERKLITLERMTRATLSELQSRLRRAQYHVFHFVGHGQFDPASQESVLVLEEEDGRKRLVSGDDLAIYLCDEPALRLAVLNACEGARASHNDPFSGAAQSLVFKGIPAVIAMQFEVSDEAAIAMASGFYAALADDYPVDAAVTEARKAIFAAGCAVEWGTPVLYLRAPDGRIFDVDKSAAAAKPVPEVSAPPPLTPAIVGPEPVVRGADISVVAPTGATQKRETHPWIWLALGISVLFVALIAIGTLINIRSNRQENKPPGVAYASPAATSEPQPTFSPTEVRSIKDPTSRDNWMESAEFQRAFEARAKAGFFVTQIEGRFNGREEFRATWRRGKSPCTWVAHHGLTNDKLKEFDKEYVAQGFEIIFQSRFTNRGTVKSQVIWAKDCDLVGSWDWSPTEVVTVRADGTMTSQYNGDGTWKKTGPNTYVMIWDNGFIDTLEISADGQVLKGRNQHEPVDREPNTYTKRSES